MSSHPGTSGSPAQPTPPAYSYAYTPPPPFDGAQISQQRSSWGLILAATGLLLALLGVILKMALPSEQPIPDTIQAAPVVSIPAGALNANGPAWTMKISKKWEIFKVPHLSEDSAWATGGGTRAYANNVAVVSDAQPTSVDLEDYVQGTLVSLEQSAAGLEVIESGSFQAPDHEFGRIEYTATVGGIALHNVVYMSKIDDGYATATYSAAAKAYDGSIAKVEPFLTTLQSR